MEELGSLPSTVRAVHQQLLERVEPYRDELWRYCLRLTGSPWDAEDLVQESLMRALARLSLVWQPTNARAYLFRIASNTWIDHVRRPEPLTTSDDLAFAGMSTPGPGESAEALDYLASSLPPRQAVVVMLIDVFDLRLREVADMLNATEPAVKGLLQRARAALRAQAAECAPADGASPRVTPDPFIARYIDAFNRRDPDAIASLLNEDCVVDIVGVGENRGRAMAREDGLRQWAADPLPQRAQWGEFAGAEVVLVFAPAGSPEERLHRIDRLEVADGGVQTMRTYFYTPELLAMAGQALGMPAAQHPRICDDE